MKLSGSDAVSALGGAGGAPMSGGASLFPDESEPTTRGSGPTTTLLALAEVLYPSEVEVTEEFVETYLFARVDDADYRAELARGAETLDDWAHDAFGTSFAALSVGERDALLEDMGVRLVDPVPDGTDLERLHYHLVEELLVAFYASPTGRELVGAEHRGGDRQSASRPGPGSRG